MSGQGILLVVSGPSGAGKGTVCNALFKKHPQINYSVSMTTRKPRAGEVHGKDYFFVEKEEFEKLLEQGELLEYAKVYDNYYGTPKKYVLEQLSSGQDVLLEIEMCGAQQVREKFPEGVFVFILPPSQEELANRLKKRGKDDEKSIQKRLGCAMEEIMQATSYDYVIVNEKIEDSCAKLSAVICAEKNKVARNKQMINEVCQKFLAN